MRARCPRTEAHARATIRGGGVTSDEEIDRRVQARTTRPRPPSRADAPRLWAVIDETAFRELPGTPKKKWPPQTPLVTVRILCGHISSIPESPSTGRPTDSCGGSP
ncbi:Scr1 family TA system antitoxin-like transcriptional regulator [Nocardiopsis halotolerans]|uniref:Scr1 family TA system antitoxin-like transcriptional regulator n=1 Tax=Nocardiopsis halotolerans TaxID=124252 RepID=UPI001F4D0E25|nr:Scr1 family TA system antitoxin-like transcriptional regulator [Nocardiopsis halotolerans]